MAISRSGFDGQISADQTDSFFHAEQPQGAATGAHGVYVKSNAIVFHQQSSLIAPTDQHHTGTAGAGMTGRIVQGLLRDPVQHDLHRRGQPLFSGLDAHALKVHRHTMPLGHVFRVAAQRRAQPQIVEQRRPQVPGHPMHLCNQLLVSNQPPHKIDDARSELPSQEPFQSQAALHRLQAHHSTARSRSLPRTFLPASSYRGAGRRPTSRATAYTSCGLSKISPPSKPSSR